MRVHPVVALIGLFLIGWLIWRHLKTAGLISLLWLLAIVCGFVGLAGLLFDANDLIFPDRVVPAILLLCSIVSLIGAGVLEYLKRAEKN